MNPESPSVMRLNDTYVGKEILVVKKDYKGWRGTLRSVS